MNLIYKTNNLFEEHRRNCYLVTVPQSADRLLKTVLACLAFHNDLPAFVFIESVLKMPEMVLK